MKKLGFRNKLATRPASDVAPAGERPSASAAATPQWREWQLTPRAALAAILFVIVVVPGEPSDAASWLKAIAAGAIIPGGAYAIVKTATGQWRLP
jgi:hypothetical protein